MKQPRMLLLNRQKFRQTHRFAHVEKVLLAGEVLINTRREIWPPNHMAYFDGMKLWRFDGIRKVSLTLDDIAGNDEVVSTASAFLPEDSTWHML